MENLRVEPMEGKKGVFVIKGAKEAGEKVKPIGSIYESLNRPILAAGDGSFSTSDKNKKDWESSGRGGEAEEDNLYMTPSGK